MERCGLDLLLLNRQGFTLTSCLALLLRGSAFPKIPCRFMCTSRRLNYLRMHIYLHFACKELTTQSTGNCVNPLYPNDDYSHHEYTFITNDEYSRHGRLQAISTLYPAATQYIVLTCHRKSNEA